MAYKFQMGASEMSGALTQVGTLTIEDDDGTERGTWDRDTGLLNSKGRITCDDTTEATSTTDGSLQTDGGLSVAKSAVIGEDLDLLSNGAILSLGLDSKFILTDQNSSNTAMVTANHRLAFGAAADYIAGDGTDLKIVSSGDVDITGDTDIVGGVSSTQASVLASTAGTTTIGSSTAAVFTAAGILNVNNVTDATTTADGSLQTDGGLSVVKNAVIGEDLSLLSNNAVLNIGDTSKFTLTDQNSNNTVMASAGHRLAFGAAGEYITGDGTDLSIVSSGNTLFTAAIVAPSTNNGASLGVADGGEWSDLFLAEGGVINWDNGDMTMTQDNNLLTIAGGTLTATLTNSLSKAVNSGLAMTDYDGSAAVSDLALDFNSLTAMGGQLDPAADGMVMQDGTVSKKITVANFAASIAGTGVTAVNGRLNVDASSNVPNPIPDDTNAALVEGFNFASGSMAAQRTYTLPASPNDGDVVTVKVATLQAGVSAKITGSGAQTMDGESEIFIDSSNGAVSLIKVSGTGPTSLWKVY